MDTPIKKKRGRPTKVKEVPQALSQTPAPVSQEKPPYVLTLSLGDRTYVSTGESILEALERIEVPTKIFVKGFVHVQHGDRRTDRMFMPAQMKRFLYPVARVLVSKALETTLKTDNPREDLRP